MQPENDIFLFHEAEKQLFDSRTPSKPYCVTPQVIDWEMAQGKSRTQLHIHGITQGGLEHFAAHYGQRCQVLWLDDCRKVRDFSSLAELTCLEALRIEYCRSIDCLWDLSANPALRILSIDMARKLCENPLFLRTSSSLEEVRLWGSDGGKYPLRSLECFRDMKTLRRIDLNGIRLLDHDLSVLSTLPGLEEFHFDAGMLTKTEIKQLRTAFPDLTGDGL